MMRLELTYFHRFWIWWSPFQDKINVSETLLTIVIQIVQFLMPNLYGWSLTNSLCSALGSVCSSHVKFAVTKIYTYSYLHFYMGIIKF